MGYRNRTIRQDFTDLGDDIWVVIRNPKLQPLTDLTPDQEAKSAEPTLKETLAQMNPVLTKMIVSWNVPDPGDDRDDAPTMPVTVESVAKLPVEISSWMGDQITEAITGKKAGTDPQDHLEAAAPN